MTGFGRTPLNQPVRFACRVDGLILRAICLMSPPEIDWMYRGGVAALQPKAWADFLAPLTEAEQADPLTAYHQRLTSDDAGHQEGSGEQPLQHALVREPGT